MIVLCFRLSRHVSVVEIDNDGRTAAFLHYAEDWQTYSEFTQSSRNTENLNPQALSHKASQSNFLWLLDLCMAKIEFRFSSVLPFDGHPKTQNPLNKLFYPMF